MERKKSLARAKTSGVSLVDLLAKESLSLLIPGYGLVHELSKIGLKHLGQYRNDRVECRLNKFHEALLGDNVEEFKLEVGDSFFHKEFSLNDYNALLEACVRDIDEEKSTLYGNLMRSLVDLQIPPYKRRDFILLIQALGMPELNLMRKNYVLSNSAIQIRDRLGNPVVSKKITSGGRSSGDRITTKLINEGLVDIDKGALNPIAIEFINLIYPKSQLTPESLGYITPSGIHVLIICYRLDDDKNLKLADALQTVLWDYRITSSVTLISRRQARTAIMISSAAILMIDDFHQLEQHLPVADLIEYAETKPLFRLNTQSNDLNLSSIKLAGEYQLCATDPEGVFAELRKFILNAADRINSANQTTN